MAQGLSLEDVGITSTENTPTPVVSSTTIPPIGKVEKQLFPMEELEKQIFGSSSRMGRQEQGLSLKDVGLTETEAGMISVPTVSSSYDPDTFGSKLDVGIEGMKTTMYEGYGLFADMLGLDETAKENRDAAESIRKELANRPQPTQSPSIVEETPEIIEKFAEGEVLEGFNKLAGQAETLTATALPSIAPTLAAYAGTRATGQWLKFIPKVGKPAYWLYKTVGTLLPGYLMGSGEVYKTAKDKGAKDEDAKLYAAGAGLGIAALESFGAGHLVKQAVNIYGKKATKEIFKEEFGEAIAEEVVEEGLKKASSSALKENLSHVLKLSGAAAGKAGTGFVKGGAIEGGTEAAQQLLTIGSAYAAAEKTPEASDVLKETIDAFALGVFGGGPIRGTIDGLSPLVRNQAVNKAKDLEETIENLPAQVVDADTELATPMESGYRRKSEKREGAPTKKDELTKGIARSVSYLQGVANRTPLGSQLVNTINNLYNDTNVEIGTDNKRVQDALTPLYKELKLPFTKKLPKEVNDALFYQLARGKKSDNKEIADAGDKLRVILDDQIEDANNNNVDVGYVENYLMQTYKFPMKGRGRSKAKKKFMKILNDSGVDGAAILDNVLEHGGVFNPQEDIQLFQTEEQKNESKINPIKQGFENKRKIPPEVVDKLDEAGLVERNVEGLINKSIIATKRRVKLQNIKDKFGKESEAMQLKDFEGERITDIFDAFQNKYRPFSGGSFGRLAKPYYQFSNTAGYILTLSLAAITALSEPIIMLSRLGPKASLWGSIDGIRTAARKTARTFMPKLKRSKLEESMSLLMQTADLALNDSVRDIGDLSVNKKITDAYFRFNMLAAVTQVSRYMAFAAANRQIKDDIKILRLAELSDKKNKSIGDLQEQHNSRKRLKEQGLGNLFTPKGRKSPMTNRAEIMAWAEATAENPVPDPVIITKALGKTVDEIIMTPNVVNRPLWMSNPHLSPFAQLKGFMMVFGNTVGLKFFKEVFRPLAKGRIPVGDAMKYAITFTLLMSAIYGTQILKDVIKYGDDEESPTDDLEGFALMAHLIQMSNILGFGNVLIDALESEKYGVDWYVAPAGPMPNKVIKLVTALRNFAVNDRPAALANWISKNTPIVNVGSYDSPARAGIREGAEDVLSEIREGIVEVVE
tara:strand:+ start:1137 stop:4589 length:3453 start_codon:yes stop_codon:yes gene_type:complete